MFLGLNLETIDINSFDISKVTNMYGMFNVNYNLKTICVSIM